VAELSWRGPLDVAPGPSWLKLERLVPAALAVGPYTFRGAVTFGGQTTSAESELYVARTLRLADDFADASSGWPSGQDTGGSYGYAGGEYRFSYNLADRWRWSSPPTSPSLADLAVEVDVRMPGTAEGYVALPFGLNADGTALTILEITRDGRYAIYAWDGQAWDTLLPLRASDALRTGEASNHLLLARDRGLTYLYANGRRMSMATDIPAPAGRSGVYASSAAPGFEARFDNFRLYDLR